MPSVQQSGERKKKKKKKQEEEEGEGEKKFPRSYLTGCFTFTLPHAQPYWELTKDIPTDVFEVFYFFGHSMTQ